MATDFIKSLYQPYSAGDNLRKTILVIDDNEDTLNIIQVILEKQGYAVQCFTNADVIYTMGNKIPDLVILDINLKQEDGRDVCSYLKQNLKTMHIPVILYTGLSQEKLNEYPETYLPDSILLKPFSMTDLKDSIVKLLLRNKVSIANRDLYN